MKPAFAQTIFLVHLTADAPICLQMDVSDVGVGVVLQQHVD